MGSRATSRLLKCPVRNRNLTHDGFGCFIFLHSSIPPPCLMILTQSRRSVGYFWHVTPSADRLALRYACTQVCMNPLPVQTSALRTPILLPMPGKCYELSCPRQPSHNELTHLLRNTMVLSSCNRLSHATSGCVSFCSVFGLTSPLRQNSCRPNRSKNLGAAMKDANGTIRTDIQRQSGSATATARERHSGNGSPGSRHWSGNTAALAL